MSILDFLSVSTDFMHCKLLCIADGAALAWYPVLANQWSRTDLVPNFLAFCICIVNAMEPTWYPVHVLQIAMHGLGSQSLYPVAILQLPSHGQDTLSAPLVGKPTKQNDEFDCCKHVLVYRP